MTRLSQCGSDAPLRFDHQQSIKLKLTLSDVHADVPRSVDDDDDDAGPMILAAHDLIAFQQL